MLCRKIRIEKSFPFVNNLVASCGALCQSQVRENKEINIWQFWFLHLSEDNEDYHTIKLSMKTSIAPEDGPDTWAAELNGFGLINLSILKYQLVGHLYLSLLSDLKSTWNKTISSFNSEINTAKVVVWLVPPSTTTKKTTIWSRLPCYLK